MHNDIMTKALLAICGVNPRVFSLIITDEFPSKRASKAKLSCYLAVSPTKLLNKQSSCHWFEMSQHSCDITVMSIMNMNRLTNLHIDSLVQDLVHLLLTHWSYCSLAPSHRCVEISKHIIQYSLWNIPTISLALVFGQIILMNFLDVFTVEPLI